MAVVLCIIGAALLLVAAGRDWVTFPAPEDRTIAAFATHAKGSSAALVGALGLAALAGVVGIAAARGRGRTVVGVVLVLIGLASIAAAAIAGISPRAARLPQGVAAPRAGDLTSTWWPWLAVAGGALVDAAGALVVVRGSRWNALSARYAAPAPADEQPTTDASLWDALSRGDDPT